MPIDDWQEGEAIILLDGSSAAMGRFRYGWNYEMNKYVGRAVIPADVIWGITKPIGFHIKADPGDSNEYWNWDAKYTKLAVSPATLVSVEDFNAVLI